MKKLKTTDLQRISEEEVQHIEKNKIIVVLDNIRSLNNVGSVFRTSDAFLIQEIWLVGITGTPPQRDIHKSALGSENTVAWRHIPNDNIEHELTQLKQNAWTIAAVEQIDISQKLHEYEPQAHTKLCVIMGNEVDGVSEELLPLCDFALEIPQWGTKHSLNISVATGVVLWDVVSKMKKIK